jgi:hypothetical protein
MAKSLKQIEAELASARKALEGIRSDVNTLLDGEEQVATIGTSGAAASGAAEPKPAIFSAVPGTPSK